MHGWSTTHARSWTPLAAEHRRSTASGLLPARPRPIHTTTQHQPPHQQPGQGQHASSPSMPLRNAFFCDELQRRYAKSSGLKVGMGGNATVGELMPTSVSPMAKAPGLVRPMTSPAKPSWTVARSLANIFWGRASVTTRPERATLTFMPFSNLPAGDTHTALPLRTPQWWLSGDASRPCLPACSCLMAVLDLCLACTLRQELHWAVPRPASMREQWQARRCGCGCGCRGACKHASVHACAPAGAPDTTRTKATRSLCLGSMLACSLKMRPEKAGAVGATSTPARVLAGAAHGKARQGKARWAHAHAHTYTQVRGHA